MKSWRASCRQCGRPPVPGRAWCDPCLTRLQRNGATDSLEFPTQRDAERCAPSLPPVPYHPWRH